jgi:aspartate carbamoyltransferase catalytic subunit
VTFVAPATLLPLGAAHWPTKISYDLDVTLQNTQPDVVMMLRIQSERMSDGYFPHSREYARLWGLDDQRLRLLRPDSIVMHPGPMNRGREISSTVADDPRCTVREQVANGVSVRMAVLYILLAGSKKLSGEENTSGEKTALGEKEGAR